MRYVPGTHTQEIAVHRDTFAENNQLSRGQELVVDVNEAEAVDVVLAPGQIALHHGRIFHASSANQTDDRRIGLAIRYISPRMQQVSGVKTYCTLVSGEDRYGHFHLTETPRGVMHPTDREMAHRAITAGGKFLFAATC
jgi:ectoine hydroxylase-related dioxygenase (phytanoyl-CoA dioxygenase family)